LPVTAGLDGHNVFSKLVVRWIVLAQGCYFIFFLQNKGGPGQRALSPLFFERARESAK